MVENLIHWFSKCSDCLVHPEYEKLLKKLYAYELTQEIIDYLCSKAVSKKHICEIRFQHLKVLLLNKSALKFDLKQFYLDSIKKSRRLWLKMFYIRGYAFYATEQELAPIMKKFQTELEKYHDYVDYEYILSEAGLPYLVNEYDYHCFRDALETANNEYKKIDPLLRGYFTLNETLEHINLISNEEAMKRSKEFLKKHNQ